MKTLLLTISTVLITTISLAQNGINYKALIKDANGDVVANQAITVQFQILQDGTINVYQETHTTNTDTNGIVVVNIGEGVVNNGDFSTLGWDLATHSLNVQVNTGTGLVDLGTTPFMAVPYALMADNVKDAPFKRAGNILRHVGQDDFLFGASSITYQGGGDNESKVFYNAFTNAFRAGTVDSNRWDFSNLGTGSFATGFNTQASGIGSVSLGQNNVVMGNYAISSGIGNMVNAENATVFGRNSSTSGDHSLLVGAFNASTHNATQLLGENLQSGANYQMAIGTFNTPSTTAAFQIGNGVDNASRNTVFSIENDGAIKSNFYEGTGERTIVADADGKLIVGTTLTGSTGLEKINEGGNEGWRLVGESSPNYGQIGANAVDLSFAISNPQTLRGATGEKAVAMGSNTMASGNNSTAMGEDSEATAPWATAFGLASDANGSSSIAGGNITIANGVSSVALGNRTRSNGINSVAIGNRTQADAFGSVALGSFNIGGGNPDIWVETDPLFEIGNERFNNNDRSNALTILKNGTITAPSFDIAQITDNKALVTKEYVDANAGGSGLEKITQNGNTGWRLVGQDPLNYGPIGNNAVDLSLGGIFDSESGAIGSNSFAVGLDAEARANSSFGIGDNSSSAGEHSYAIGRSATTGGSNNYSFGRSAGAGGTDSYAIGRFASTGGIESYAFGRSSEAVGTDSYAFGRSAVALASNAYAFGEDSNSSGANSYAFGFNASASGNNSYAIGESSNALGNNSTAIGTNSSAIGINSLSINGGIASGTNSVALTENSISRSYFNTAVGRYNVGFFGNTTSWVETDPLFEIGNGTDNANRSNAITVLKNGKVGIGDATPDGYLEVLANNSFTQPNINVVDEGSSGARINFTNTATTNGNVWSIFGDTDDTDSNSSFNIFHSNTGNIIDINGDGKVGINGDPDADFQVFQGNSQSTSGLKLQNTNNDNWWRMYVSSGSNELRLFNNVNGTTITGRFNATSGAYTTISDRRLKTNFKDLYFSWDAFLQLEPLTYHFKTDTSKKHVGLIAQDVEKIYPELISYDKDEDLYHLDYSTTGIVAIKAVQELKAEKDALEVKVALLEKKLLKYEVLEERLSALENSNNSFENVNVIKVSKEE